MCVHVIHIYTCLYAPVFFTISIESIQNSQFHFFLITSSQVDHKFTGHSERTMILVGICHQQFHRTILAMVGLTSREYTLCVFSTVHHNVQHVKFHMFIWHLTIWKKYETTLHIQCLVFGQFLAELLHDLNKVRATDVALEKVNFGLDLESYVNKMSFQEPFFNASVSIKPGMHEGSNQWFNFDFPCRNVSKCVTLKDHDVPQNDEMMCWYLVFFLVSGTFFYRCVSNYFVW